MVRSLCVIVAIQLVALPSRAVSPGQLTQKLIDTFKKVRPKPADGELSSSDARENEKVYVALDRFFDYEAFASACLGPVKDKVEAAQVKEFNERLRNILRRQGYANGGAAFSAGVVKMGKTRSSGDHQVVPTNVTFKARDLTVEVQWVWNEKNRIIDLILDDDSLTADFSNQIGRLFKKEGMSAVLQKLKEKQKSLDEAGL